MKRTILSYALLFVSLAPACSGNATTQENSVDLKQKANGAQAQVLQKQFERIASAANGKVGVAAAVLETRETVSFHSHDHFPMQSVYKLPIGMAVLSKVDAGKLKLEQKVQVAKSDFVNAGQYSPVRDKYPNGVKLSVSELLRFAVSESDGTASDVLMRLVGGPAAVQAFLTELKITEWIVLNTEKEIGQDWQTQYRNWATPEAAIALLRAVHDGEGLSKSSHALVLKLMTESIRGERRLKALLPAGTIVPHKTGTSGSRNGIFAATNDIGIITLPNGHHVAIAVFVSDSPADEATREGVIAKIARAVWERFATD